MLDINLEVKAAEFGEDSVGDSILSPRRKRTRYRPTRRPYWKGKGIYKGFGCEKETTAPVREPKKQKRK